MRPGRGRACGVALALGLVLSACGSSPPAPGVTVLTYASPYSPTHPFSRADREWIAHVEKASAGRLKIKPFWGGSLISSDQSVIELRHGVADIALVTPIYMRAGMHAMKTQAGFYTGVKTIDHQVAVYRCIDRQFPVFGEEMAGVRVLAVQGGNLPNVLTRDRPVTSLADLRGLRLRAPSELVPVLRGLGVDVVTMPMGEVYSAISKGIIDGVVAPADTLKSLHFNEVADQMSQLSISRGAYPARAISETSWRRTAPELQWLLEASIPVWEAALRRQIEKAEAEGIDFGRANGVKFNRFPAAEQARFDAIYDGAAAENARRLIRYGAPGPAIYRAARAASRSPQAAAACVGGADRLGAGA
jgi:TRAP-type transport system periplasmic protein